MPFARLVLTFIAFVCCLVAQAQIFKVSSPTSGDFLGRNNSIRFTITGASFQARVVATYTSTETDAGGNPVARFQFETLGDPNPGGEINGSINTNFSETAPTGIYTLKVEYFSQGNLINTVNISNLTIDTRNPKFRGTTPGNNSFVNRVVVIRADIEESNLKKWTVTVGDKEIPNNTGTTNPVRVDWDTSNIEKDGPQSISIQVEDQARNIATKTISVTLDRIKPVITISSPTTAPYRPRSNVPVSIEIADQGAGSVAAASVSVSLRTLDGQFIGKVARISARQNGNNLSWTGRIRKSARFPSKVKVVVTAVDRAGNAATIQEVTLTYGG